MIGGSVCVARILVLVVGIETRAAMDICGHFLHAPFRIILLIKGGLTVPGFERVETVLTAAEPLICGSLIKTDGVDPGLFPEIGGFPDLFGLAVTHAAVGGEGFAIAEEFGEVCHSGVSLI